MSLQDIFKKEKKTPEEIKALSDLRQNYYNYMNATTVNISNLVKENKITPETSTDISNLISTDKKWLQSNPNTDFETMQSKNHTIQNNIKDLIDTDKPKIQFSLGLDADSQSSSPLDVQTNGPYYIQEIKEENDCGHAIKILYSNTNK